MRLLIIGLTLISTQRPGANAIHFLWDLPLALSYSAPEKGRAELAEVLIYLPEIVSRADITHKQQQQPAVALLQTWSWSK